MSDDTKLRNLEDGFFVCSDKLQVLVTPRQYEGKSRAEKPKASIPDFLTFFQ